MRLFILVGLFVFSVVPASRADFTIDDYNAAIPVWGTTWKFGKTGNVGRYYPSYYTGFAMRTFSPERLHIRTSRGNQTRVTLILDEQTVTDYLFDLVKRYEVYRQFSGDKARSGALVIDVAPPGADLLPQTEYFYRIVDSAEYGIRDTVLQANSISPEALYSKALAVFTALNPGRVFPMNLDLRQAFLQWKEQLRAMVAGQESARAYFEKKKTEAVIAIDSLLWGRIDYTGELSGSVLDQLSALATMAQADGNEDAFVMAALDFFKTVTGNKYQFRTVNANGEWQEAIQCAAANSCYLVYTEFTTIYPTGSHKAKYADGKGNEIPDLATPGLWQFLSRDYHEVDNIRDEAFYAFAPKLDYEGVGNGFHNPAVGFWSLSAKVKEALEIPAAHTSLSAVKRGGVSSGCLRLAVGHLWEMRQMMPVENEDMERVLFFGHKRTDFDVFDIDGNGSLEVMGVEYMISYGLQGDSGLAKREGKELEVTRDQKLAFYRRLYGNEKIFTVAADGTYLMKNPTVSLPSSLDHKKKSVATQLTFSGEVPLYEQTYERDKVQLYAPFTTAGLTDSGASPLSKRLVRLMGRIRGCAPATDKEACGEAAFDREAEQILAEIQ